jgi:hypothetical protein
LAAPPFNPLAVAAVVAKDAVAGVNVMDVAADAVVANELDIALLMLPVIGTDEVMDVPVSINELVLIVLMSVHIVNLFAAP